MKLQAVKEVVFKLTSTISSRELKKQYPDLTKGRDLRYKSHWLEILEQVQVSRKTDLSLEDLQSSEEMLKDSLFNVGRLAGLDDDQLLTDWHRIKLVSQWGDIHIEEL
jgi:hypothetical protein